MDCRQERTVQSSPSFSLPEPAFYNRVLIEMQSIGFERIKHVDQALTSVSVSIRYMMAPEIPSSSQALLQWLLLSRDSAKREHTLTFQMDSRYPEVAPRCNIDLPTPLELRWSSASTLRDALLQASEVCDGTLLLLRPVPRIVAFTSDIIFTLTVSVL